MNKEIVPQEYIDKVKDLIEYPSKITAMVQFKAYLLDSVPDPKFVEKNKYAGNSSYVKIAYMEQMLDLIDPTWSFTFEKCGIEANAYVYVGTLEIKHPITGNTIRRTGIGAVDIEVKAGSDKTDFANINAKAVHKNAPAAKSYAFKNAAQSLGKLFGRDLNRTGIEAKTLDIMKTEAVQGITAELKSSMANL